MSGGNLERVSQKYPMACGESKAYCNIDILLQLSRIGHMALVWSIFMVNIQHCPRLVELGTVVRRGSRW